MKPIFDYRFLFYGAYGRRTSLSTNLTLNTIVETNTKLTRKEAKKLVDDLMEEIQARQGDYELQVFEVEDTVVTMYGQTVPMRRYLTDPEVVLRGRFKKK